MIYPDLFWQRGGRFNQNLSDVRPRPTFPTEIGIPLLSPKPYFSAAILNEGKWVQNPLPGFHEEMGVESNQFDESIEEWVSFWSIMIEVVQFSI